MAFATSGTTYRAMNILCKYSLTTLISNILPLSKPSLAAKHVGLYSLPPLTTSSFLSPENSTRPTDYPGVQIIKRG